MLTKRYSNKLIWAAEQVVSTHIKLAPAYKFLSTSEEPRLFLAIQAYRHRITWPYSFPLEQVYNYDVQKDTLNEKLLKAINSKDKPKPPFRDELINIAIADLL